jgi:hypothetical protein
MVFHGNVAEAYIGETGKLQAVRLHKYMQNFKENLMEKLQ